MITSWSGGTRICSEVYYTSKLKQLLVRIIFSIVSLSISRYQDLLIYGGIHLIILKLVPVQNIILIWLITSYLRGTGTRFVVHYDYRWDSVMLRLYLITTYNLDALDVLFSDYSYTWLRYCHGSMCLCMLRLLSITTYNLYAMDVLFSDYSYTLLRYCHGSMCLCGWT